MIFGKIWQKINFLFLAVFKLLVPQKLLDNFYLKIFLKDLKITNFSGFNFFKQNPIHLQPYAQISHHTFHNATIDRHCNFSLLCGESVKRERKKFVFIIHNR